MTEKKSKAIRIGINGFGRIGRLVARALLISGRTDLQLIAINSPASSASAAHLLQYDSVHGVLPETITAGEDFLNFSGSFGKVSYSRIKEPKEINWRNLGVDLVLECSGKFNDKQQAMAHLTGGAKKILISAPAKQADKTIVYGVNHHDLSQQDLVVSAASCTTNCLAPVAWLLEQNFGIVNGFMTTVHAYTGDQQLVDNSHKDLRRARAAALSMIPTSTGAAKSIGEVIPNLKGKLDGSAIRVPTANVSCIDLVVELKKAINTKELHQCFITGSETMQGYMGKILTTSDLPLVSSDFNGMAASANVDLLETSVRAAANERGHLVRVLAWYDNEMGFSHRMLDVAAMMGRLGMAS